MVISEAVRERIEAAKARFPQPRGALLAALHLVQEELGHIPPEAEREVADLFGLRPVEVHEVVSFYNMFHSESGGRHRVYVCTNLPCSLRGARTLLRHLESHLGIRCGQTTPDGRITLGHEECLGACAYAPMMRVDRTYHEDLDPERAVRILDELE